MPDIKVQYITGTMGSLDTSATPTITAVGSIFKAFVMSAASRPSVSARGNSPAVKGKQCWAILESESVLKVFREQSNGEAITYAFWIVEYVGPAGGANEFKVERHRVVCGGLAWSGSTTYKVGDTCISDQNRGAYICTSGGIGGGQAPAGYGTDIYDGVCYWDYVNGTTTTDTASIAYEYTSLDIDKCVVFGTCTSGSDAEDLSYSGVTYDLTGDGYVEISRSAAGGVGVSAVCYVVEFTGWLWSVQKVSSTFPDSDVETSKNHTISISDTACAFIAGLSWKQNATYTAAKNHLKYLRIASTTTLVSQIVDNAQADPFVCWIVENPQLVVARYGTPDNYPDEWAGTDNTQDTTVTALPSDSTLRLATLQAGAAKITTSMGVQSWLCEITSTTNVRAVRNTSALGDDTDYHIETLDFSALENVSADVWIDGPGVQRRVRAR